MRQIILLLLLPLLVVGCSDDEGGGFQRWGGGDGARPDVGGDAGATKSADGGASPERGDDRDQAGADGGAGARTKAPAPERIASCGLVGAPWELEGVVDADMVMLGQRPLVLAVVERRRSEPLDIEGSEPLPEMRSLFLFVGSDGEGDEAQSGFEVVHLVDDPGPIRDHFGRRSYERLVAARSACDGAGCLVGMSAERVTPGTETRAYLAQVQRLDEDGEPQGSIRVLAQEPDRGVGLASCLGVSNEGFLWATSVRGGRGRLLWLDRRATPLDMRYFTPGFDDCAIAPLGLAIEVAVHGEGGIRFESMGGEPEEEDAGPGPWRPELPESASAPGLIRLGDARLLAWSDGARLQLSASTRDEPVVLLDSGVRAVSMASAAGRLFVAFIESDGSVGVDRLDAELAPDGRGRELVEEADQAWVLARSEGEARWLGWRSSKTLRLQRLGCPAPEGGRPSEARALATSGGLTKAEARNVDGIRRHASRARSHRQNYRAAWLYERAYHHNTNDIDSMIRSAGLLTEIRYTKSSLRQLERLADRDMAEIRAALRNTCNDRDFERLWTSGEFQRLTGCAPPPDPEEEEEEEEEEEGEEDGEADDEADEGDESSAASSESESEATEESASAAPSEPSEPPEPEPSESREAAEANE